MKKKRSKKRGPVRAKRVRQDGINFASGLERYMYLALKKAKIKAAYEGETYVVQEGFEFTQSAYEKIVETSQVLLTVIKKEKRNTKE